MLYARALRFGLQPSTFWRAHPREVNPHDGGIGASRPPRVDESQPPARTHLQHQSRQRKALGWEDFYPYEESRKRATLPDMDDARTLNHFKAMGQTLNNGN